MYIKNAQIYLFTHDHTTPYYLKLLIQNSNFSNFMAASPWILGTRATKWSAFHGADNDSASFHVSQIIRTSLRVALSNTS